LKRKVFLLSLVAMLALCIMLVFAQFAFATVVEGGSTGPQTGGSSGGKTGAPLLAIGAVGAAMAGAGYLLKRKSAA
jgi:hypothetical protein